MQVNLVKRVRVNTIDVNNDGKKEKKEIRNVDFFLELANGQLVKIAPYTSETSSGKYSTKQILSAIADDITQLPFDK